MLVFFEWQTKNDSWPDTDSMVPNANKSTYTEVIYCESDIRDVYRLQDNGKTAAANSQEEKTEQYRQETPLSFPWATL